jgi:hypothetical protein
MEGGTKRLLLVCAIAVLVGINYVLAVMPFPSLGLLGRPAVTGNSKSYPLRRYDDNIGRLQTDVGVLNSKLSEINKYFGQVDSLSKKVYLLGFLYNDMAVALRKNGYDLTLINRDWTISRVPTNLHFNRRDMEFLDEVVVR